MIESLTEIQIEEYLDLHRKIRDKSEEIVEIFDQPLDHDSLDTVDLYPGENNFGVTVGGSHRGEYMTERYCHPVDYLFKSTDELKEIKKELDEECEKVRLKVEAKEKAKEKERRRKEYLKLKEEFEKED